jgi:5'-deoxynucleotidase YfbR-like HD superfamily hydrolase
VFGEEGAGIRKFVHDVRDLMLVRRFTTVRGFQMESVAEHSYYTTLYAMLLCDLEEKRGEKVDLIKLLRICLLHDLEEARVSDIPRPVKHANPKVLSTISSIGQEVYSELVSTLPQKLRVSYMNAWKDAKGSSFEARIYKAADLLEALVWAAEEDAMGNMRTKRLGIAKSLFEEIKLLGVPSATRLASQLLKES